MGLDVGIFGSEEFFYAILSKALGFVDNLTAAVVAVAGIAFGIFVRQA